MSEGSRGATWKAVGQCSILALDKSDLDFLLGYHGAAELVQANCDELMRAARRKDIRSKFKKVILKLKLGNTLKRVVPHHDESASHPPSPTPSTAATNVVSVW